VPFGKLVTLEGDQGVGKSILALTMAATVSVAGLWPDGTRCDAAETVLLVHQPHELTDTVRPRLEATDADLTRIHSVSVPRPWTSSLQAMLLTITCLENEIRHAGARLLVVDLPLVDLLGTGYKTDDLRQALVHLAGMAERTECTVLLVAPSDDGRKGLFDLAAVRYRVTGSGGGNHALTSVKNNLAAAPPSLIYRLVDAEMSETPAAVVQWLGVGDSTAVALLAEVQDRRGDTSKSVAVFVNSRPVTTSADVVEEFGGTSKAANQDLCRLAKAGHIRKIARGKYGPLVSAGEDAEDSEVSEDSAGQDLAANHHAPEDNSRADAIIGDSETGPQDAPGATEADPRPECPDCGARRSKAASGQCGTCIAKRHNAEAAAAAIDPVGGPVTASSAAEVQMPVGAP
jgi:hypothetical protein